MLVIFIMFVGYFTSAVHSTSPLTRDGLCSEEEADDDNAEEDNDKTS
jgi:hypothetical protein